MQPTSPRNKLARTRNVAGHRPSHHTPSRTPEAGPADGSGGVDQPDPALKQESLKKTRHKHRRSLNLDKIKELKDSLVGMPVKVASGLINRGRSEQMFFASVEEEQAYQIAQAEMQAKWNAARSRSGTDTVDTPVPAPPPDDTPAMAPIPPDAPPAPVRQVVLVGSVEPWAFHAEFRRCLDELAGHQTPQHLNVGMTFVWLNQCLGLLHAGPLSAEQIGGSIDTISAYLLPSLSRMFARLEDQLVQHRVLHFTLGFRTGLLEGLSLFHASWQYLNEVARSLDPGYPGTSLFAGGGPQEYLEHQWSQLQRLADHLGARLVELS